MVLTQNPYNYHYKLLSYYIWPMFVSEEHGFWPGEYPPPGVATNTILRITVQFLSHLFVTFFISCPSMLSCSSMRNNIFTEITSSIKTEVKPLSEHKRDTRSWALSIKLYTPFHFHNYALQFPLKQSTPKSIKLMYIQFLKAFTIYFHKTIKINQWLTCNILFQSKYNKSKLQVLFVI